MNTIKINGDTASGKTTKLMSLARDQLCQGSRVLYVSPLLGRAESLVNAHFSRSSLKPEIASCDNFHLAVRAKRFELIIFDDFQDFKPNPPDGSYLAIAISRLSHLHFGTIAYSTNVPEGVEHWVSTSVWYKPWTWGKGFWK